MKRFLLWIISVALGVALLLAAVMGVSYAFTTQGGCPDASAQFGGQELETNGFCWQVPLLGGRLDKVFASPATLTVQKLGTLYTAHPDITLPDWASYTTLTIQTAVGSVVFAGSVSEYQSFLFPANGEYKAAMTLWRVPKGGMATQFEGGSTGALRKNLGLGGLLVTRRARNFDLAAKVHRVGVLVKFAVGHRLRQHTARYIEDLQNLVVPVQRVDVEQHRPAGVGVVGHVDLAAGQLPDQPGFHRAEQQIAPLGPCAHAGDVIEYPL